MSTAKQPTAEPGTTAEAGRVRVLCFGDSLTSGHCSGGLKQHPYSQRLADLLTRALPGKSVEVLTNGVPGDVASSPRFHQRLQRQLDKQWFDWVVILGGTNDLGWQVPPEQILAALNSCWALTLGRNAHVLAMTVPPLRSSVGVGRERDDLNASILAYKQTSFHTFDLKAGLDSVAASDEARYATLWDDNVHFSPTGYDWIGEQVAQVLLPLIEQEE